MANKPLAKDPATKKKAKPNVQDDPNLGAQEKNASSVGIPSIASRPQTKITAPSATGGRPTGAGDTMGMPVGKGMPSLDQAIRRLNIQPRVPDNVLLVEPPVYSPEEVMKNEPEFVGAMKNMLWNRMKQLTPTERDSDFWRHARGNVEGAAASIAARLLSNMQIWSQKQPPKLNEAMKAKMSTDAIYKSLSFVEYGDQFSEQRSRKK